MRLLQFVRIDPREPIARGVLGESVVGTGGRFSSCWKLGSCCQ
jgi:hypothetical protein